MKITSYDCNIPFATGKFCQSSIWAFSVIAWKPQTSLNTFCYFFLWYDTYLSQNLIMPCHTCAKNQPVWRYWVKKIFFGWVNGHGMTRHPFSSAALERFFSHFKVVKTELRSKLSAKSLNSIMRIRMKGLSLEEFNQDYASKCADF